MFKLLKLHLKFIINKKCLYILIFAISLIIVIANILINELKYYKLEEISLLYFEQFEVYMKIILYIICTFIFGYSFSFKIDNYYYLLCVKKISRLKHIITKIIAIIFFNIVIGLIFIAIFFLVALIYLNYYKITHEVLLQFIVIILNSLYFGFIAMILVIVFKSIYVLLVAISISIFSIIINETTNKLLKYFFVIFDFNDNIYNAIFYDLTAIFVLVFIGSIIYSSIDLLE